MADAGAAPFVVFSDDWGEHPSSCQHLFGHITGTHPVLWVNTVGMRAPSLSATDVRKAYRKVSRMLRSAPAPSPARPVANAPRVCQPLMLPLNAVPGVRSVNELSVVRSVRRACAEMGVRKPVVVSTVPNACDYVGRLDGARVVYYCVDDFTKWPGLEHELVQRMETDLIAKADVLIATSQHLYRALAASGKPTHLLTHGVDIELFTSEAPAEHECLAGIPHPRLGYFGLFDERSDQQLIAELARCLAGFSFVITGPVVVDASPLQALPNVHFTGAVEYRRLPELIRGLDVLFLPYVVDELSKSISPLKLKEYLATGKPVVSTPLAEAVLHRPHLVIASSVNEWQAALQSALAEDVAARRQGLKGYLAGESWHSKAREFLRMSTGS
jgi:hypothetical protein